jgi:hypothetical protein
MDCPSPPEELGVEGLKVVDVPEQMDPAPLLQTRIMVVGSMEITDQHPLEQLAQYLIHHLLVPACSGPGG